MAAGILMQSIAETDRNSSATPCLLKNDRFSTPAVTCKAVLYPAVLHSTGVQGMHEGETQDQRDDRLKQEQKDGRRDRVKLIAIYVALLVALALLGLAVVKFWPAVTSPIEFDPKKRF